MHMSGPSGSSIQAQQQAARWLVLIGGVVNPIAFVLAYTVAGFLRPGYSQIHQAISDLGVGPNGPILDGIGVVRGLLLIAFAIGFALLMRSVLSRGWLWLGTGLQALLGVGFIIVAIFTDAPATVGIHTLATAVDLLVVILLFLIVGLGLRHAAGWRGWGTYSLVAALVTVLLVAVLFLAFRPGTPLAAAQVGGLVERVVSVETLAWFVAFGWRLFRVPLMGKQN